MNNSVQQTRRQSLAERKQNSRDNTHLLNVNLYKIISTSEILSEYEDICFRLKYAQVCSKYQTCHAGKKRVWFLCMLKHALMRFNSEMRMKQARHLRAENKKITQSMDNSKIAKI